MARRKQVEPIDLESRRGHRHAKKDERPVARAIDLTRQAAFDKLFETILLRAMQKLDAEPDDATA